MLAAVARLGAIAVVRFIAVLLFIVSFAVTASAESPTELKQAGDVAFDAQRFAEAADAYERALAASGDPALHYNLSRAYAAMGRYPEALRQLEMFADRAPTELRRRVPKLDAMFEDVRRHVSTILLDSNVAGARISIGGAVV